MDNKKVGKTISNLRKKNGMTQMQLGEKLFVSDKAVSRWETGEGLPEILNLIELSKIFNVSMEYILKGEGANLDEKPYQEEPKTVYEPEFVKSDEKQFTQTEASGDFSAMSIVAIVLGGVSILCNLFSSFISLILAIVGLVMSKAKPGEEKTSFNKIAKILNIIALILSVLLIALTILLFIIFGSMFGDFFDLFSDSFESMNNNFNNFIISIL